MRPRAGCTRAGKRQEGDKTLWAGPSSWVALIVGAAPAAAQTSAAPADDNRPADAATAKSTDSATNPADIVVTATRRSERLQDVPLSVRSEEHTSELQSLMRISYAVFCLTKNNSIITDISMYVHTTQYTTYLTY